MHRAVITSALVVILAAGLSTASASCGKMDAGSDAAPDSSADAPLAACGAGAFSSVAAIAELNTADHDERGLRFTPNELLAVFSRTGNLDSAAPGPLDLFQTTRATPSSPLEPPTSLPLGFPYDGVSAGIQLYPSVTTSRAVFTEAECRTISGFQPGLCVVVPADAGTAEGFVLASVNVVAGCGPFGPPLDFRPLRQSFGDGFVTEDGGAWYFASLITDDGGLSKGSCGSPDATAPSGQALFVAHPPVDGPVDPPAFETAPVRLTSDPSLLLDNPVLTDDELTLYASATTASDATPHVYVATRATTADTFGAFTPLHELDSPEGEYPSWVSADQCRLYLSRKVGGQWDLYLASRSP